MSHRLSISLLCLTLLLCSSQVLAEPDDTQQAWLDQVDIRANWDVAVPVEGIEATHHMAGLFQTYFLAAAERVTVRVPAGERLGVYRLDGSIDQQQFEFSWSNGSGLFASLPPDSSHDEHSLVVTPPTGGATLMRIKRKGNAEGKVELALFTSREANRLLAVSYREILAPLSSAPALRLNDGSQKYDYWHADPAAPLQVEVEGATRIRIDSRLLLPDQGGPGSDSYRIVVTLDGEPWRVFDLATLLDTTANITVEGRNRPTGRPAYAYLDIPDGHHRLELQVQRSMLLRLLERQQPDDYFYQDNRPLNYQDTVGSTGKVAPDPYFWNRPNDEPMATDWLPASSRAYLDTVRIAKDNSHRLGGATSIMPLKEWAWRYPDQQQYQSIATRRQQEFTFFRNLHPQQETGNTTNSIFAWFLTPRLQENPGPIHFPENYAGSLAGSLASGYFATIPAAREGAQRSRTFLMPEQVQARQLRISVDRSSLSSADTFYVQLDEAEPVRFRVENNRALAAAEFQPNTGTIALALLQRQNDTAAATLSGAFAAQRAAAPLVNAGFLELLLTKPVRKVNVWRDGAGTQPIRVALAYRTSSWYQMSESAYLDLLNAVGSPAAHNLFRKALSELPRRSVLSDTPGSLAKQAATSMQQDMNHDLYNQWEPLLRFLYARYALFTSGVADTATEPERLTRVPDDLEFKQAVQQAETAEASAHWHVALERWGQIQRNADGKLQATARSRQVHALRQSGNGFLAKQLLRHDFLYARQSLLRQQALDMLIDRAGEEGDAETALTLRTVAAINNPVASNLHHLAVSLMDTGRSRFAMNVLLGMPQSQRPATSVLQVSYDLGWWQWFEQTLTTSPDQELNAFWQGYRAQLNGDYERALEHWQEAGPNAQKLSELLTEGLEIRHGLSSPDQNIRRQAVVLWEEWQKMMPEPNVWIDIPQSVTSHNGALSVYSTSLGESTSRYKATPEKPMTVAVYGPMSLRFEVRPLHDSANGEPVSDWIIISTDGAVRRYPIIDNRVSASLQLTADEPRYAGQKVEFLHEIPAGYHELQLSSQHNDVLVGITALRARFPLTVLPPLNPHTVRSALSGDTASRSLLTDSDNPDSVKIHVTGQHGEPAVITLSPFLADQQSTQAETAITLADTEWLRGLDIDRNQLMNQQDPAEHPPSLKSQLIKLLWEAEQKPEQQLAALSQAEALVQDQIQGQPDQSGTGNILRRLRREASWELVRSAQQSAGIRQIDFVGWQPEAPETRTRKAIMGLVTDNALLISGYNTRVLSMYNVSPVELTVELSIHDAAYRPIQPVSVLIGLDDLPESVVSLSALNPATTLTKNIGIGNHVLRIRLAAPVPNQFLRIRFIERRNQTGSVASTAVQRSYMVATSDQPLVLLQQGPTRLRIDEWRDGQTLTNYRTLAPGWQQVTVPVEPGREEALLRVFQRRLEPGKPVAISRAAEITVPPVADPLWTTGQSLQSLDRPIAEPLKKDLLDGTWSLIGGWVSRRIVDDEPLVPATAEKFVLLGGAYRKYSARWGSWFYADGRLRIHQEGNPTFATRGAVTVRQPHWPLDLDLSGSYFRQRFDASGQFETATAVRARLSRTLRINEKLSHRPSVSVFQRWLSLDDVSVADSEKVDQDIFTRYKRDHLRGLRIGDRIQYRPWLDTVLYADGYAASNEDLNVFDPDHLGLHLGARQLIRDLDLGVRYSRFEYFKDSDRNRSSTTQRLRFDLGYTRWFSSRYGLRSNLSYEYDQGSGDSSIYLSLSLNRSNGRYYRDFRSSELDFRWLRERRLLEQRASSGMEQAKQ